MKSKLTIPSFILTDRSVRDFFTSYEDLKDSISVAEKEILTENPRDVTFIKISKKVLAPPALKIIRSNIVIIDEVEKLLENRDWVYEELPKTKEWLNRTLPVVRDFENLIDELMMDASDKISDLKKRLNDFAKKFVQNMASTQDRIQLVNASTMATLSMSYNIIEYAKMTIESTMEEFYEKMPKVGYGAISINTFKIMFVKNAYYSSFFLILPEPRGKKRKEEEEAEVDITALLAT